jgi:hypothetical protein
LGTGASGRESWLRRPASATWFLGIVHGSTVLDDWLGEKQGIFGGVRFGWDFNHYWGTEFRLAFSNLDLWDSARAKQAQRWADDARRLDPNDPYRWRFDGNRNGDLFLWDFNALYYPWGDTRLRPYCLVGIGATRISFMDRLSRNYDSTHLTMPVGLGLKYLWTDWMALRFECLDNIAFGAAGVNTLHHLSVTGGVEVRFGGSRASYWPWNPARQSW